MRGLHLLQITAPSMCVFHSPTSPGHLSVTNFVEVMVQYFGVATSRKISWSYNIL